MCSGVTSDHATCGTRRITIVSSLLHPNIPRPPAADDPGGPRRPAPREASQPFSKQPADHRLRGVVVALPDVTVPDDAFAIDEDSGRPGPNAVTLPDGEVVVLDDRIADAEPSRGLHHLLVGSLPEELGAVDADNAEPGRLVS